MKFMLDTNICIYLIKQKSPSILKHLKRYSVGDIGISSITLAELYYGVEKSRYIQINREALGEFLLPLEITDFDEKASQIYGVVRANLEKDGNLIGSMDMLIASHALSLDVTLITNNTREFKRIKQLKVSDWTV
ncbi:MAG: type II toxin-antitoxin system VapC family toxin [Deltaproteobacteria bacterium]|nr:type II toxin-antitoxin system VapC family toxin [Deltaproteobacteria bacterium]